MDAPPTRYRVVERGRRLEVIDTWSGERVTPLRDRPGATRTGPRQETSDAAEGAAFTTKPWFDDKAPRIVRMNYATTARIKNLRYAIAVAIALVVVLCFLFWPLALILPFALLGTPKLRDQLRGASTRWIDGLDQA